MHEGFPVDKRSVAALKVYKTPCILSIHDGLKKRAEPNRVKPVHTFKSIVVLICLRRAPQRCSMRDL